MSEPAGRAVTPAGLPAEVGAGGAASPAPPEIGQPRVWLAAAASYAAIGTVFQVLPPYTAAIGRALGVSATAAGLGMTVFLLPVPLLAVPAGAFCDRRGSRLLTRAGFGILLASAVLLAAVPGSVTSRPPRSCWPPSCTGRQRPPARAQQRPPAVAPPATLPQSPGAGGPLPAR